MNRDASLLPFTSTSADLAIEAAVAAGVDIPVPIVANARAETAALDHLPFLAWAYSVDAYDSAWTASVKRAVIAASIDVHRVKGTVGAVKRALRSVGVGARIVEWFQPAAQPGALPSTFEIWIGLEGVLLFDGDLGALLERIRTVVDAAKPASAHYTAHASLAAVSPVFAGAGSRMSGFVRNRPGLPEVPRTFPVFKSGALSRSFGHLKTPFLEAP